MLIDENSFMVNNHKLAQYVTEIKYGYNKIWGSDAGRNTIDGSYSGTFVGVFPKIQVTFGCLTQQQIERLAPILDSAFQEVVYYDPNKKRLLTIQTYTGDYELSQQCLFSDVATAGRPFTISFIATKRRVSQ